MSMTTAIIQECEVLSQRLAVNPVIDDDEPCVAVVAGILHHSFVRGAIYLRFEQSVEVFRAFYSLKTTIMGCDTVVDEVQAKDIRAGDTVYLGLDKARRIGVVGVDLTRRKLDAVPYVCPPEHCLPPVNLADYD